MLVYAQLVIVLPINVFAPLVKFYITLIKFNCKSLKITLGWTGIRCEMKINSQASDPCKPVNVIKIYASNEQY